MRALGRNAASSQYATPLRILLVCSPLLMIGCDSKLPSEQQRVKAQIVKAHQGDAVTFLSWSQTTVQGADVMQFLREQSVKLYGAADAKRRDEHAKQQKARTTSLVDRKIMEKAWKKIDDELAASEERRASLKKKWEQQDREWQAADKAGKLESPTRATDVQERIAEQRKQILSKKEDERHRSSKGNSESTYKKQWADEDKKWEAFIAMWTGEEQQAKLRDEKLSAPIPDMTLVHVRYRAPNRVGLNQLEEDVFSVAESKVVRITDNEFVAWLLPKMK